MPDMAKSGRKTAITISVAKAMGRPTSRAASSACRRRPSAEGAVRRWKMFSVMMIAASTRSPTAIARPPSVMVLMPTPSGFNISPERAIDSGRVSVTTSAARRLPRRTKSTPTTSTAPRRTARPTPPRASVTRSDWS
jgi:hypothetical protein